MPPGSGVDCILSVMLFISNRREWLESQNQHSKPQVRHRDLSGRLGFLSHFFNSHYVFKIALTELSATCVAQLVRAFDC